MYIFVLLLCIGVNEALTKLLSRSVFFGPLRAYLESKQNWLFKFFSRMVVCPYCSSVWTSAFLTLLVFAAYGPVLMGVFVVDAFLFWVACHRFSNHFHDVADRYFSKDYK